MSFKNCFINLVIPISLLMLFHTVVASVFKTKCGESTYIVEIKGSGLYETRYNLYYKVENQPKELFYKTKTGVILDAACIQDIKKRNLMLFLEFGGGNVGPEDRYGVFDPSTKKMLIQPTNWNKGNFKQVEKIIGYSPPVLNENDRIFFCCYKRK